MPIVQIELLSGRTVEQKRQMVKEVTQAIASTLSVSPDAVHILIRDMETHNYSRAGVLWCDKK